MACCVIAAFCINKLVTACEKLHFGLDIQYNDAFKPMVSSPEDQRNSGEGKIITKLSLTGLTCAACTVSVETALKDLEGVESVRTSLQLQQATVIHDERRTKATDLKVAVEDLGYGAEIGQRSADGVLKLLQRGEDLATLRRAFIRSSTLLSLLFLLNERRIYSSLWPLSTFSASWPIVAMSMLISSAIQWYCGSFMYRNSWIAATKGRVNMDSLIAFSTTLGVLLSLMSLTIYGLAAKTTYFQTCAALTTVVVGGRYLDSLSKKKSDASLLNLFANRAESAMVNHRDGKRRVPASFLGIGDEIIIDPYTTIPCDCYVLHGFSQVDESIISGESTPVSKAPGSLLLSGSRNGSISLDAVVYRDQENSTLAFMISNISDATEAKASSQSMIDSLMQWFVVGVFSLAFSWAIATFLLLDSRVPIFNRIDQVGKRTMTILTAACPCAIGLSIPSATMAGIDSAWRDGILIAGGATVIEKLKEVTCLIMDKTGTLTEGALRVVGCDISEAWVHDWTRFCLLICATEEPGAAVHPAGRAVFQRYLSEIVLMWPEYKEKGMATDIDEIPGQGIYSLIRLGDGSSHKVCLGNEEMMRRYGVCYGEPSPAIENNLVVHVAINGCYVGRIFLQDTIRVDAQSTLERLKSRNLKMMILTGDTPEEAQRVSQHLNIPVLAARATPSAKLGLIKELQKQGHTVAMVGDGINDAPSLAAADVGIMISTNKQCFTLGGSILILSPKFSALAELFDIVEHTVDQVRSNLIWAFVYNATAITLALGVGHPWGISISPPIGAALMSLSSVGIAFRSLATRKRPVAGVAEGETMSLARQVLHSDSPHTSQWSGRRKEANTLPGLAPHLGTE